MSGDIEQKVDKKSVGFKQGAEVGLNTGNDMKAGNELGQEPKEKVEDNEPWSKSLLDEASTPLFLRDSAEGKKGNAQDEKDGTEE